MSFEIEVTPHCRREIKYLSKKYPSLPDDLKELQKQLLVKPQTGQSLGKAIYKIRMNIRSKRAGKASERKSIFVVDN